MFSPFNMICLVTQGNVVFCIILHFGVKCHTIEFFLKKMAYFIVKLHDDEKTYLLKKMLTTSYNTKLKKTIS